MKQKRKNRLTLNLKEAENFFINKPVLVFFIFALLLYFIIIYHNAGAISKKYNYKVGDIAREDIVVTKDIQYIDEEETAKRKNELIKSISPVYLLYESKFNEDFNDWKLLFKLLKEKDFKIKTNDEIFQKLFGISEIDQSTLNIIIEIAKNEKNIDKFKSFLYDLYKKGIINKKSDKILKNNMNLITVNWFRENEVVSRTVKVDQVISLDKRDRVIENIFKSYFPELNSRKYKVKNFLSLVSLHLKENLFFDPINTNRVVKDALKNFKPVMNVLKRGKIIVRHGEEIKPEDIKKIELLNKISGSINYKFIFSTFLLYSLFITGIFFLIKNYYPFYFYKSKYIIFIFFNLFLLILMFFLGKFLDNLKMFKYFIIPIGAFYFLFEIVFSKKFLFILTFFTSILLFILFKYNWQFLVYSSLLGLILIFDLYPEKVINLKEKTFIKSGIIFMFNIIFYFIVSLFDSRYTYSIIEVIAYSGFNSLFSAILFFGIVPIVDYLFNFPTIYKLIEIMDLNNPIFEEFLVKAPGTYQHSIIVANLSEKAAIACGANSYLAKAGALYHDIGKMKYAEYFIENKNFYQASKDINTLSPNLAVAIIKNHVKVGIDIAKKLRLPEDVIQIIMEHHGTTTINYFYKQALELSIEKSEGIKVLKEDFSYKYPKPSSKESAIVMLADAVEAIARLLKDVNYNYVEKKINELFHQRFLDGQLDNAPLTLSDLTKIKDSMIKNVIAMIHQRINYPDKEEIKRLENISRSNGKE